MLAFFLYTSFFLFFFIPHAALRSYVGFFVSPLVLQHNTCDKSSVPTNNQTAIHDSGDREKFNTGSVRDIRSGKGRYDLLPTRAMRRLAKHFENGAKKYGDRNWEKGQPVSRYLDSALRHTFNYLEGRRDEDHLAAAAWNVMAAIETVERVNINVLPKELDDVPGGFIGITPQEFSDLTCRAERDFIGRNHHNQGAD